MRHAALLGCLLVLTACEGDATSVSIEMTGVVGGEAAACGETYAGIGTTGSDLELADFRLYVHDVRLLTAAGEEVPVTLTDDGVFQREGVAHLDFEDGTAGCENGNAQTNGTLDGTIEGEGPFTGIRFRLGVPFDLNHGDVSTSAPPLDRPGMFWNWNGGYKFLRIDGRTTGQPAGVQYHIGSTGCDGDGRGNVSGCANDNRPEIELTGADPTTTPIIVDVAALLSESDLDGNLGGPPGCMSGVDDMDCVPVFHGLGLSFDGVDPSAPQRLFRFE